MQSKSDIGWWVSVILQRSELHTSSTTVMPRYDQHLQHLVVSHSQTHQPAQQKWHTNRSVHKHQRDAGPCCRPKSYRNCHSNDLFNDKFIRFRHKTWGTSFWFLIWSIFALGKSHVFILFSQETLLLAFEFTNSTERPGLQRLQPY